MKTKAFLFLLLAVMLQACNSSDTLEGTAIDAGTRKTIKQNNDRLLQAFAGSNMNEFRQLGTTDFVTHLQAKIANVIWPFRKGAISTDYKLYKEYYAKNERVPGYTVLDSEEDNYKITVKTTSGETYISMLLLKYNMTDDYLLTVVYSRENGQWKISDVKLGLWGMYGKGPQQYFEQAKESEKNGHILDAFFAVDVAHNCLKPMGDMLAYNNADKILFYEKEWMDRCNAEYRFPQYFENVTGQPAVVELTYVKNPEGTFPMFRYATAIAIQDSVALTAAQQQFSKAVKDFYKGMDFDSKKFIYYRAYNDPHQPSAYHEFKDVKSK